MTQMKTRVNTESPPCHMPPNSLATVTVRWRGVGAKFYMTPEEEPGWVERQTFCRSDNILGICGYPQ